jgi:hypothetical protein
MARVLTHATNATALQYWQLLIAAGQASDPDRRAFVELAIRTGSLNLAAAEVQKLLAEAPNEPLNLWLAAQLYSGFGDYNRTVYYATRAQLHDPANKQYQLFLSSLLLNSSEPDQRTEAQKTVWDLARDLGPVGLQALNFLAARPDLTAEQRQALIPLLQQHPQSGIRQQLLVLDQRLRLEPARRPEILDQAMTQYTNSDSETLSQFALWLNQNEEFHRTLTVLPLAQALKRKELFMPHVDALAALDQWVQLDKILNKDRAPLELVYVEAFRARCAAKLGKELIGALKWKKALRSAERNPPELAWLAAYAEKCGEVKLAQSAYRALIACVADIRPAYLALERLTARAGTTEELRNLADEMLRRWPQQPALRNDVAYLNALLAQQLAEAQITAEELVSQFPDSLPFRTTLALARLRLQDAPAALRVYVGRQYDWRVALPANRAVYAAVLAANGQTAEARDLARSIPTESLRKKELRKEEFDLLSSIP